MEELILQEFEKQNSKAGQILMMRNLNLGLFQKLNPKQQSEFQTVINKMIENGLITYEDGTSGPECIRLTELGYSNLYKNSLGVFEIESKILKEFENQNSRAGQIIMFKNLNFRLVAKLNPKEKELFNEAVNNLINKGFVTYEDGSTGLECLRLTELGFENLY